MDLASKYDHWSDACVWLKVASFISFNVRVEQPPPLSVAMATIVSETYFVQRSRFSFSFCATCSARNSATNDFNSSKSEVCMFVIFENCFCRPATPGRNGREEYKNQFICRACVAGWRSSGAT